jgi:hypothetical protein
MRYLLNAILDNLFIAWLAGLFIILDKPEREELPHD